MTVPTAVYMPGSQLRFPRRFARALWRDFQAAWQLATRLAIRDVNVRYRQSALGFLWAFAPPLMTAVVFIVLNRNGVFRAGPTSVPYPVYVLFGTILWQVFADGVSAPLRVVSASKSMLVKINFPREALIISAMLQSLFDLGVKLVILAGVVIWFQIGVSWAMIPALGIVLLLMLLGFAVGLVLTPLGLLYTDVGAVLPTITTLWFFLTPVVYPIPADSSYAQVVNANPVTPLLVGARQLATEGSIGALAPVITVAAVTVLALLVLWVVFRVSLSVIVERLGS